MKRMAGRRAWRYWLLGGAVVGLALVAAAGEALSWPATRAVGAAPAELQANEVLLPLVERGGAGPAAAPAGTGDPATPARHVAGWYSPGRPGAGAVLLLHGVRGDRRAMLGRARFLHQAGYAVMLLDLPSHGASSGERITFGLSLIHI